MVQSYLSVADFTQILNNYAGRTVSLIKRTLSTDNITGEEIFSDGTPANITCYFLKQTQRWEFDKIGKIEGGDAVLLAYYSDGLKKDDKIVADGEEYVIRNIINVPGVFDVTGNPTFVYSYSNLFKVENS